MRASFDIARGTPDDLSVLQDWLAGGHGLDGDLVSRRHAVTGDHTPIIDPVTFRNIIQAERHRVGLAHDQGTFRGLCHGLTPPQSPGYRTLPHSRPRAGPEAG